MIILIVAHDGGCIRSTRSCGGVITEGDTTSNRAGFCPNDLRVVAGVCIKCVGGDSTRLELGHLSIPSIYSIGSSCIWETCRFGARRILPVNILTELVSIRVNSVLIVTGRASRDPRACNDFQIHRPTHHLHICSTWLVRF